MSRPRSSGLTRTPHTRSPPERGQRTPRAAGAPATGRLWPGQPVTSAAVSRGSKRLRAWQQAALDQYTATWPRDHLVTATPGAGKTTFAFAVAGRARAEHRATRLVVVTPTDHLRTQWIEAATAAGFDLRATPNGERLPADADGVVATYAQVAAAPRVFEARCATRPTLVVFDEVHHTGDDKSWGSGVMDAFDGAAHRLAVTGTPFRSDSARIPHVLYEETPTGGWESVADFTYGYADGLRDGVVRPVRFASYTAASTWRDSAGDAHSALLGDPDLTRAREQAAWRTALDHEGEWVPHVIAAAAARVTEQRLRSIPDACALMLASNQETARAYAAVWETVTGVKPLLILSDDDDASRNIARLRDDPSITAAVSVRMVSEGVDIPRASVLVYACTSSTPLFFAQAVGRVVRARNRRESATVFLPAVTSLLGLAAALEEERSHVIDVPDPLDEDLLAEEADEVPAEEDEDGEDEPGWVAVSSSATFDALITSPTGAHPIDDDGQDDLFGALPGLLTVEQEKALLAKHEDDNRAAAARASQAKARAAATDATSARDELVEAQWSGRAAEVVERRKAQRIEHASKDAALLRRHIASLVTARAARKGESPQEAWAWLYRAVPGPKNAEATLDVLQARLERLT